MLFAFATVNDCFESCFMNLSHSFTLPDFKMITLNVNKMLIILIKLFGTCKTSNPSLRCFFFRTVIYSKFISNKDMFNPGSGRFSVVTRNVEF